MFLFRDVMDKGLVDAQGHKAGKVDDVLLELRPNRPPAVRSIVSGRGAARPIFPAWMLRLAGWVEDRAMGPGQNKPTTVGWEHVTKIDVVVHLDLDRDRDGLMETQEALWQRWIKRLPWAER